MFPKKICTLIWNDITHPKRVQNIIFAVSLSVMLILLGPRPEYSRRIKAIKWLMMPWLIASPDYQETWYCLCRINGTLWYTRQGVNHLRHLWRGMMRNADTYFMLTKKISPWKTKMGHLIWLFSPGIGVNELPVNKQLEWKSHMIMGILLHCPSLVALRLSVKHGLQLVGITLLLLTDLNIGWYCPSCNGMWTQVTGGNFQCFQSPLTVPVHSPNGKQMPTVMAV